MRWVGWGLPEYRTAVGGHRHERPPLTCVAPTARCYLERCRLRSYATRRSSTWSAAASSLGHAAPRLVRIPHPFPFLSVTGRTCRWASLCLLLFLSARPSSPRTACLACSSPLVYKLPPVINALPGSRAACDERMATRACALIGVCGVTGSGWCERTDRAPRPIEIAQAWSRVWNRVQLVPPFPVCRPPAWTPLAVRGVLCLDSVRLVSGMVILQQCYAQKLVLKLGFV